MHNHGLNDFEESRPLVRSSCLQGTGCRHLRERGTQYLSRPGLVQRRSNLVKRD